MIFGSVKSLAKVDTGPAIHILRAAGLQEATWPRAASRFLLEFSENGR